MKKNKTQINRISTHATVLSRKMSVAIGLVLGSATLAVQAGQGPQPTICNRACWGARAPQCSISQMGSLTRAIIHHTGSASEYSTNYETSKAKCRGNQSYVMDTLGYCDADYHFYVDGAGNIFEGRSGSMSNLPRGSHDGCNANSFGYAVLGNFETQAFPSAARNSLEAVIAWRQPSSWSATAGNSAYCSVSIGSMEGHYRVKATACPGANIISQIGAMRTGVTNRKNGSSTPTLPPLFSVSSDGLVTTASDSAGKLVVFGLESDNTAGLMTQTSPNGGWPSSWAGLGTWTHQMLAFGKNSDSRLEIFSIGSDNACNRANQTSPAGGWSGWSTMGGWMTKIAVARNANGTQEVFGIGSDQRLYHTWQTSPNGGWHAGWTEMGNYQHKDIIVGQNADGRLEVFTIGTDNACNKMNQTSPGGTWTSWSTLGGSFSSIGVGRNLDGRLEVFGISTSDQKLYHCWQMSANGGWHAGWDAIGNYQHKELVVGQNDDGRLEVFTIGTDDACNRVNQTEPNGSWAGWSGMGGSHSSLAVGRNADGRQELFAISSSNKQMYHAYQTVPNGGWSAWLSMGGSFK